MVVIALFWFDRSSEGPYILVFFFPLRPITFKDQGDGSSIRGRLPSIRLKSGTSSDRLEMGIDKDKARLAMTLADNQGSPTNEVYRVLLRS